MEQESGLFQLLHKLNSLSLNILKDILPYLDTPTKAYLCQFISQKKQTNLFYNLLSISLLANQYLTSTDRSIYLSFYSSQTYIKYQNSLIAQISSTNPHNYLHLQKQNKSIIDSLQRQLTHFESASHVLQLIQRTIIDPQIPMPKMRKQGIATYCNSSLQLFMADLKFNNQDQNQADYVQQCVLDLQTYLQSLTPKIRQTLNNTSDKEWSKITHNIQQIYHHPEIINMDNYQYYLVEGLTAYNLFVCFHALISSIAFLYQIWIQDQTKQFEKFVEFQLRFCIFRSILVNFEENFLSKVIYNGLESMLNIIKQFLDQQKDIILQTHKSEQELSPTIQNLSRIPSQVKTIKSIENVQNIDIFMSTRVLMAGCKIWSNQNKKIKELQSSQSPSKLNHHSNQQINNKAFIKILDQLSYTNIIEKLQAQINQSFLIRQEVQVRPLRDQDIVNIFGNPNQNNATNQRDQNQNRQWQSPMSPSSPTFSGRNINQNTATYSTFLMNIQNKLQLLPYRFQKSQPLLHSNLSFSNNHQVSPNKSEKQQSMPEIDFAFNFPKIPNLRDKRVISKASIISKFSRMTDLKIMSEIEELVEADISIQEQILLEYQSYVMDMLVNQNSVHWCGHSKQQLNGSIGSEIFTGLEQCILKYNEGFIGYLFRIGEQAWQCQQKEESPLILSKVLKSLLQWHLQYMDNGYISKLTLNKIQMAANERMVQICIRNKVQQNQVQKVTLNLCEVDKTLEYYNEKVWLIGRNVETRKLKVYQQCKYSRGNKYFLQSHFNKQNDIKEQKCLGERRRRNSEQTLIPHSLD